MLSGRHGKPLLNGLVAVLLLFAARLPAGAQSLSPLSAGVTAGSLSFSWTADGASYFIALSTAGSFSVVKATGSLSAASTTYAGLGANELYYFRVKRAADPDSAYSMNQLSTVTYAAAPSAPYFISDYFTANASHTASVNIGWSTNGNPEWTDYIVSYSTSGAQLNASFIEPYPPVDIGGLSANTTYFFKVRASNLYGNSTAETSLISTATLALKLPAIGAAVHETSATVSWTPVTDAAQARTSEGYELLLSTSPIFSSTVLLWKNQDSATASKDLAPLDRNTTYYYFVGALNWNGAPNFDELRNFTTLSARPRNLVLSAADHDSVDLAWTALPAAPPAATALAYRVEASSTDFNGAGLYITAEISDIQQNAVSLSGLDANTTYYFRIGSLNRALAPNYSTSAAATTLSLPFPLDSLGTGVSPQSVTVTLDPPFPALPQGYSCEGYILEGSSRPFGSGAVTHSSVSYSNNTSSLTLSGLRANTTYYLRLATLNWAGTPNYATLPAAVTALPLPPAAVALTSVWQSSAAVSFASADSDGYVVEASTYEYFNAVSSSFTAYAAASSLAVSGLEENTVYHFRAGALYNGATIYTLSSPEASSTLARPLTAQQISGVFYSSVTVSWTPLATGPQRMTAESYVLETATAPSFPAVLYSSSTAYIPGGGLGIVSLLPNTSYYFRAGSVNWDGARNYVYTPGTSTLANQPLQSAFTGLATGQMTVNWSANLNPSDTLYTVRLSSNPGFTAPVYSSATRNAYATFTGLMPNTTYFLQTTALNRLNLPTGPLDFTPMATLAFNPVQKAFSGIGVSSVTLNWGHGDNPVGYTYYKAELSSSPVWAAPVLSSVTLNNSATFYSLVSNATYYLRVSALNYTGVATELQDLGEALTLPATPYLLAPGSAFSGLMIDGFTLHWGDNGNSPLTKYNLLLSTAGDFNAGASSQAVAVSALEHTFIGLLIDTTYWAQIQAEGQGGTATAFLVAGSTKTVPYAQGGVTASADTTVTLEASYGTLTVIIPAGSLGGSTRLKLKPVASFMPPVSAAATLTGTGIGLEITHFPPALMLNPITVILPYRPGDLPAGTDRSRLVIALYDAAAGVWVPLPSVSDLTANKVTARTWHLSTFQLMELTPGAGLSAVRVYPNPYTPSSVSSAMHFTNMPPYSRIKLYTFLGELVKEFTADINGTAYWSGTNSSGQKVASGVYIALIETRDKKSSRTVKVAVER